MLWQTVSRFQKCIQPYSIRKFVPFIRLSPPSVYLHRNRRPSSHSAMVALRFDIQIMIAFFGLWKTSVHSVICGQI